MRRDLITIYYSLLFIYLFSLLFLFFHPCIRMRWSLTFLFNDLSLGSISSVPEQEQENNQHDNGPSCLSSLLELESLKSIFNICLGGKVLAPIPSCSLWIRWVVISHNHLEECFAVKKNPNRNSNYRMKVQVWIIDKIQNQAHNFKAFCNSWVESERMGALFNFVPFEWARAHLGPMHHISSNTNILNPVSPQKILLNLGFFSNRESCGTSYPNSVRCICL